MANYHKKGFGSPPYPPSPKCQNPLPGLAIQRRRGSFPPPLSGTLAQEKSAMCRVGQWWVRKRLNNYRERKGARGLDAEDISIDVG